MAAVTRVLLVDDHTLVREGLKLLLNQHPEIKVVAEAGTVKEAVSAARKSKIDLVLLDLRLRNENGLDACKAIQKLRPDVRILVLTSYLDEDMIYDAVAAGVDGYVLKEISCKTFFAAIADVMSGKSVLDPAAIKRLMAGIRRRDILRPGEQIALLSRQERRVMKCVSEGKTNKEIASELSLSDKTVKNYLSHILQKLGLSRRSQVAAFYIEYLAGRA